MAKEINEKLVKDLEAKIATLETDNQAFIKEIEELKAQIAASQDQIKAIGDEKASLKKKIEAMHASPVKVNGFRLDGGDPYAAGVLCTFVAAGGDTKGQSPQIPFVLPKGEKASIIALESYVLRANGGCDRARAEVAQKALDSWLK